MLFNRCSVISRKLSAYIDRELPPGEQAAVTEHLSACAACASQYARLTAADSGIRQLPGAAPAPFFPARVSAAARALKEEKGTVRSFLRLTVPAAALLVAFILLNLFTFTFNINAMENGPRRDLARRMVAQLARPASLINPLALSRLCGECNKYICFCMQDPAMQSKCPCKDCPMKKLRQPGAGKTGSMENMEEHDVH